MDNIVSDTSISRTPGNLQGNTTLPASSRDFDADVAIVGYGPVGAMLAVLLGQQGHKVIVVERWPDAYGRPRAVTYDHEIARILAILGIDSDNDSAVEYFDALYYWRNAAGQTLLEVDWASIADSGWRTRYWFSQPELEKQLHDIAESMPNVKVRRGWEARTLTQNEDGGVLSGVQTKGDAAPLEETIRARYVVGADGANSVVRTSLNLPVDDLGFNFDWLILDMIPHGVTSFDSPHWQLCDPARPTTIVPGGPGRRRWEFMVLPGESIDELNSPETAWRLLQPWGVNPENATLERNTVYRFEAKVAQKWRKGRGLIAGDAAHLMPPFAGEGMCAGLRDAVALSWRLDLVLSGRANEDLLDSYGEERKVHVRHYIDFSVHLGSVICVSDPAAAAERDRSMIAALESSDKQPVDTDLGVLGPGAWSQGDPHAGELSVQGVVQIVGHRGRFDDVIGRGWMVIGRGVSPADVLTPAQLRQLEVLGGRCVRLGSAPLAGDVIDVNRTYANWFDRIGANFVVLRPDFYVAASAATAEQLRDSFSAVMDKLHIIVPDSEDLQTVGA